MDKLAVPPLLLVPEVAVNPTILVALAVAPEVTTNSSSSVPLEPPKSDIISEPESTLKVSLPPLPVMVSDPTPPVRSSAPASPTMISSPSIPLRVLSC